jgi:hypothetical protein
MAKHKIDGKGFVSKGLRSSGGKLLKRPQDKPNTGNDNNAIREAFMTAKLTDNVRFSRMGSAIIKAAQNPVKRSAEAIRGWSAKLSFKTYNALKEQGVLS